MKDIQNWTNPIIQIIIVVICSDLESHGNNVKNVFNKITYNFKKMKDVLTIEEHHADRCSYFIYLAYDLLRKEYNSH